ncbi:hypothetical protein [Prescottella agglutinans]|uniref:Terminase small subunit n=1 Tax=Prescottella agglutinans TaxID=1644129 RepID=A0ABT6M4W8_9NOCA|nr:hypothetical protein [Prescottella agglutinans]MDH6279353.1 hypothetical protein [Prescottella agglutinans]
MPPTQRNSPSAPAGNNSIEQAAAGGSRREVLVAMRTRIAAAVDDPETPPRDLAALSKRLIEVMNDIDAIDNRLGGDEIGQAADTPDEDFDGSAV